MSLLQNFTLPDVLALSLSAVIAFFSLYSVIGKLCRAYFVKHLITVDGLPLLGLKRAKKIRGTAIICGGSISGLLAARVCSDHFTDVLIIDPELTEVERTKPSARIAQYDSLHGYLTFVFEGMRRLWPNFESELLKAGGNIAPGDVKPYFGGVLLPAPHEEYEAKHQRLPETMYIRRPQLENLLRKLVLGRPSNVRTLTGSVRGLRVARDGHAHVRGLRVARDGHAHVTSVVVRTPSGEEVSITDPTLVVDCSGDSQAGFKWLKKAGYQMPPDVRLEYDQRLYYVTITFEVSEEMKKAMPIPGGYEKAGWLYTFVPHPKLTNTGFSAYNNHFLLVQLCCGGWGDVSLPLEANDIETFVTSLDAHEPIPTWLLDTLRILVADGSPTFKPLKIRPCSNIQYHKVPDLPVNFVAVGDSVLQLNPIYAQGCSKAMMGATTLNSLLASSRPIMRSGQSDLLPLSFSKSYFRAIGYHGQALWDSTKTFDYGFSSTRPVSGESLSNGTFARWYLDLFVDAALKDKELASIMWHVRMLLSPPTDMLAPSVMWKVGRNAIQSYTTTNNSAAAMAELIRSIRQRYGFDMQVKEVRARRALEHLRDNMQEALRSLSEDLYAKDTHFVLEFIQNADDNSYAPETKPCVSFRLDLQNRELNILCNEKGFSAENIEAICSVGKSTKKNKVGYIGEKGIGFKSVFKVADVVHISSQEYTFKFDKNQDLGMVIPIWTEDHPVQQGWTSFLLSLSEATTVSALAQHLNDIQPSLLLFLRKLRRIEVVVDGAVSTFRRSSISGEKAITRLTRIQGTKSQVQDYLLVKGKTGTYAKEPKREGVTESEIVLAFPVSGERFPVVQDQAVHAFLPIRTYRIPFIIQADFLLAANREDILVHSQWNLVLRNGIARSFVSAVLRHFPNIPGLLFNWPQFVPEQSSDPFLGNLRQWIIEALAPQKCLLCADDQFRAPAEVIILGQRYRRGADQDHAPLVPSEYMAGKHYLDSEYMTSRDGAVLKELGARQLSRETFFDGLEKMDRAGILTTQDPDWFERVSAALLYHYDQLPTTKRNPHLRYSFIADMQKLRLVRLIDGHYTRASQANLFFDVNLGGIPRDLGIHLVEPPAWDSSYYRLLRVLGVREANASSVVDVIRKLHARGPPDASHIAALPSHARFLFQHDRDTAVHNFYVITSKSVCTLAKSVYINIQGSVHPTLQRFIDLTGVDNLHSEYLGLVNETSRPEFILWLQNRLGVNLAPRVLPDGSLSKEFTEFTTRADTATFLDVLRGNWATIQHRLGTQGIQSLKAVMVICSDQSSRQIHTTFVKRPALQKMDDLPFLPLADPKNEAWDFLAKLGVSLTADAMSYVKLLKRMKARGSEPTKEDVEEIYRHLETRYNEGNASKIRKAFKKFCLVWVPRGVPYTGPMEKNGWISSDHAVRNGPHVMQTKFNVCAAYPSFRKLFEDQLVVSRCPEDILLKECQDLETRQMTPEDKFSRLSPLLLDICAAIIDPERTQLVSKWLPQLADLHIFPVRTPQGNISFLKATDKFFVPDKSQDLANMFANVCTVLHCPRELPLLRIKPLLESSVFVKHMEELEEHVTTEVTVIGTPVLAKAPSRQLTTRIHYLRRCVALLWART
ncbi:hypothetical protein NM688_g4098 [Phlebia brevispora]|uniref:Uncharacterized protein n=1 Tax=Phlebia brevispora TaxID=194682 RepID=A0ACC1T3L4_9APHY|nr:hypothetical protein NM688_g4098 [Phlebia brevispora]